MSEALPVEKVAPAGQAVWTGEDSGIAVHPQTRKSVAAMTGAHIVTIPIQFLATMVDYKYSKGTVRQIQLRCAKKAPAQIRTGASQC
jgi:hypothetical protein